MRPKRRQHLIRWGVALAAPLILVAASISYVRAADRPDDGQVAVHDGLVLGLDGATYPVYKPSVIEWVQKTLKDLDRYGGEVDGTLDRPTEQAIAAFQKAHGVHASGVPSPRTRSALREAETPQSPETSS